MLAFRKDAVKLLTLRKVAQNRKGCSKIVKVAQKLPTRICLGLLSVMHSLHQVYFLAGSLYSLFLHVS